VNVTINPSAAVSAGALWNLDGGSWQSSGTTLSNITTGSQPFILIQFQDGLRQVAKR